MLRVPSVRRMTFTTQALDIRPTPTTVIKHSRIGSDDVVEESLPDGFRKRASREGGSVPRDREGFPDHDVAYSASAVKRLLDWSRKRDRRGVAPKHRRVSHEEIGWPANEASD